MEINLNKKMQKRIINMSSVFAQFSKFTKVSFEFSERFIIFHDCRERVLTAPYKKCDLCGSRLTP